MPHHRPRVLLLSDDDAVTGTVRRLTRLAVHLTGQADVMMATLAATEAPGPQAPSIPVVRIGSARTMNMDPETWEEDYLLPRLDRLISSFGPDALVIDGDIPGWTLNRLHRAHRLPHVEIVSALDRHGRRAQRLLHRAIDHTVVLGELLPGDIGRGRHKDSGGAHTARTPSVPPLLDAAVLQAEGRAQTAPYSAPSAAPRTVVLDLAGLSPDTAAAAEDLALEWYAARHPEWTVTLLDSPVGRRGSVGVEQLTGGVTPALLARTVAAVAVPGYRALHTWAPAAVPTLWLTEGPGADAPLRGAARRPRRKLRAEQVRALRTRAERIADLGWGLHQEVEGPHDIDRLRAQLTTALESMQARLWGADRKAPAGPGEPVADGAEQAAQTVLAHALHQGADAA
ncbi:hypothetical protein [Nesterenkonia suensis]